MTCTEAETTTFPTGTGAASAAPEAPQAPEGPVTSGAPAAPAVPGPATRPSTASSLRSLAIDVAVPLGLYYLLRNGFGQSLVLSLAVSSIIPAARTIFSAAAEREVNLMAGLILMVNIVGIGISFWAGDPRLLIAKDSAISSVIGLAILGSVVIGRPLMTAGLKPWLIKGSKERDVAWDRLAAGSAKFRRLEKAFSAIWGTILLIDCVARVIGAFTLPVSTMVWLSTVMTVGAIGVAAVAGGIAAAPMEGMLRDEVS
jgi:hypothetical protein